MLENPWRVYIFMSIEMFITLGTPTTLRPNDTTLETPKINHLYICALNRA